MDGKRDWLPTYIISIILIIVVAAFTILYFQLTSRITDNNNAINALTDQNTSLQNQLSSANSQISSLGGQITTLTSNLASDASQITNLNTQLTSANSQITSITKQLSATASDIDTLKSQTTSSGSQISSIQNQMSTIQTAINQLQSQSTSTQGAITALQTQLNTAENTLNSLTQTINTPVTLFSPITISQGPGTNTLVYTFTPAYSGYVSISGTSSSATGYITIVDNDLNTSNTYVFGRGTTVYVLLTAGDQYSIYFGNHDTVGTITATITGMYQL